MKESLLEATKEMARVTLLAIIPVSIVMVEDGSFNWTILLSTALIALLRAVDKFLHEQGKATGDENMSKGLTRF
jgi:hypothetical protein